MREVEAAVQSLKTGKSAGVDNIPAELDQAGGADVITALATICNRIWLVRHNERGKKTRQTEEEVERQHSLEWTGLEFAKSQRAVENRENGGNLL